jgi:hypothetical protein
VRSASAFAVEETEQGGDAAAGRCEGWPLMLVITSSNHYPGGQGHGAQVYFTAVIEKNRTSTRNVFIRFIRKFSDLSFSFRKKFGEKILNFYSKSTMIVSKLPNMDIKIQIHRNDIKFRVT